MFIELVKNNGTDYLRLSNSVRITNGDGEKVSKKTAILYIGPLARLDDGQPDYLTRLRQSFITGKQLIAALEPYCAKEKPAETYRFRFTEGSCSKFL